MLYTEDDNTILVQALESVIVLEKYEDPVTAFGSVGSAPRLGVDERTNATYKEYFVAT